MSVFLISTEFNLIRDGGSWSVVFGMLASCVSVFETFTFRAKRVNIFTDKSSTFEAPEQWTEIKQYHRHSQSMGE